MRKTTEFRHVNKLPSLTPVSSITQYRVRWNLTRVNTGGCRDLIKTFDTA